jgi:hypothetical protein
MTTELDAKQIRFGHEKTQKIQLAGMSPHGLTVSAIRRKNDFCAYFMAAQFLFPMNSLPHWFAGIFQSQYRQPEHQDIDQSGAAPKCHEKKSEFHRAFVDGCL